MNNVRFRLLGIALTPLVGACGPTVGVSSATEGATGGASESGDVQTSTTSGQGSDVSTSSAGGESTGDTDTEPEPSQPVRIVYNTPEGIAFRDVVDGVIGESELVVPGLWQDLRIQGDDFVAQSDLQRKVPSDRSFAISSWREPEPWMVDCPEPPPDLAPYQEACSLRKSGDQWVLTDVDFSAGTSGAYRFVVGPDGPGPLELLYPLGQGEVSGYFGSHAMIHETDRAGEEHWLRILLEPGAQTEPLFSPEGPSVALARLEEFGLAAVRGGEPTDSGWSPQLHLLDVAGPQPTAYLVPLLPGAVGHSFEAPLVHPDGGSFIELQRNETGATDVVWIPFEGAELGAPVLVSTGLSQGTVGSLILDPPRFNPTGEWISYVVQPDPETPARGFVVPWPGGAPIEVGENADGLRFGALGKTVYFRSGPAESRRLSRASLEGGVVGPEEVLFDAAEPGIYTRRSDDGSTLAMVLADFSEVWAFDLTVSPPVAQNIPVCNGASRVDLSESGSVMQCSFSAPGQPLHLVVALQSGESAMLDAIEPPALLSL